MVQWDGRGENEVEKQKQGIFLFFIGTCEKVLKCESIFVFPTSAWFLPMASLCKCIWTEPESKRTQMHTCSRRHLRSSYTDIHVHPVKKSPSVSWAEACHCRHTCSPSQWSHWQHTQTNAPIYGWSIFPGLFGAVARQQNLTDDQVKTAPTDIALSASHHSAPQRPDNSYTTTVRLPLPAKHHRLRKHSPFTHTHSEDSWACLGF